MVKYFLVFSHAIKCVLCVARDTGTAPTDAE